MTRRKLTGISSLRVAIVDKNEFLVLAGKGHRTRKQLFHDLILVYKAQIRGFQFNPEARKNQQPKRSET